MEVQTAFSPPHQLFKSKMRTKSEEKHISLPIDEPLCIMTSMGCDLQYEFSFGQSS